MKNQKWPKRDLSQNYFPVPNEVFLLNLSPGARANNKQEIVSDFLLGCATGGRLVFSCVAERYYPK